MKKKPEKMGNGNQIKADSQEPVLTRRAAIKRLAAIVGSTVVGATILGQVPQSWGQSESDIKLASYYSFRASYYNSRYSSFYSSTKPTRYNSVRYGSYSSHRTYSSKGYNSSS